MATLTLRHHIAQALRFHAADGVYVGIGRSSSWPDDNDPPDPDTGAAALDEPIGYKPVDQRLLLVLDDDGNFTWADTTWRTVDPVHAYAEEAYHVYIEAQLIGAELPLVAYRQVGLFSGLQRADGTGLGPLLPAEVDDPGILEAVDHRAPEIRASDKVDHIGMILRF